MYVATDTDADTDSDTDKSGTPTTALSASPIDPAGSW